MKNVYKMIALFYLFVSFGTQIFAESEYVSELSSQDLEKFIAVDKPVFVKVFAEWCPPCRKLKPMFELAAQKYQKQAYFAALNSATEGEYCKLHNINGLPSYIIYFGGKVVGQYAGCPATQEDLDAFIEQILDFLSNK